MFIINEKNNEAESLKKQSFSNLKIKERQHLQEWIDKNPAILGEKLLIIQKEFDGFLDTNERLDLLALDTDGNLVVIENKLDDSGRDVTWQALKYVSYASGLLKHEIKDIYQQYLNTYRHGGCAEENLQDFFETDFEELQLNTGDQRMILVSAVFRKEVTSTVMWLLDHGLNIKCIRVTPYQLDEQIFLDTEQILPPPDTEDFRITLTNRKREENKIKEEIANRHKFRLLFWDMAIPKLQKLTGMYGNISPTKDNWIVGASGYSGIGFNCVITQKTARAELYIGKPDKEENKRIFDALNSEKKEIENEYGTALSWDRLDEKNTSKVSLNLDGVNAFNEEDWDKMIKFLGTNIDKLNKVLSPRLKNIISR